jgi:hypothetical protein
LPYQPQQKTTKLLEDPIFTRGTVLHWTEVTRCVRAISMYHVCTVESCGMDGDMWKHNLHPTLAEVPNEWALNLSITQEDDAALLI